MPLDDEELDSSQDDFSDYVLAVYARSTGEADEFVALLKDNGIPAIIDEARRPMTTREVLEIPDIPGDAEDFEDQVEDENDEDIARPPGSGMRRSMWRRALTHGVGVCVPEELLDEALMVIADRGDLDEFDEEEQEDEEEEEDDGLGLTEELEEETDEEIEETLDEEQQPLRESESLEDDELEEEDDEKEP